MEFLMKDALEKAKELDTTGLKVGYANINVIGIGGGGGNAVTWLHKKGIEGAKTYVMNSDKQHLDMCSSDHKILIGKELTKGLGCGGHPSVGKDCIRESMHEIRETLRGSDLVFICAGLGGGTGTGGAPLIANLSKESGAIVIGVVTMPFDIERARIDKAEFGLQELREHCNTVVVIDNNLLVKIAGDLPIKQAFAVANELVSTMIKGIVEIIAVPALVNLDYADVKAIMLGGGVSTVGIGEAASERRVEEATKRALTNPLLEVNYEGANGALIHVTGGEDLTLEEVNKIGEMVTEALDVDANVIWGARIDDNMNGRIRVMTIITGVNSPYLLDKANNKSLQTNASVNEELGIDLIKYK